MCHEIGKLRYIKTSRVLNAVGPWRSSADYAILDDANSNHPPSSEQRQGVTVPNASRAAEVDASPRAGLSYQRIWQDGFSEGGVSGLALAVAPEAMDTLRPYLGADLGKSFDLGGGRTLKASADVTWSCTA